MKLLIISLVLVLILSSLVVLYFKNLADIGAEAIQEGYTGTWSTLNRWEATESAKFELETTNKLLEEYNSQYIDAKYMILFKK